MAENVVLDTGYFDGVLDLYYAVMTTEDTPASAAVYDTPKVLAKNIETQITPRYRQGKLEASNATVRNKKVLSGYDLSINVDAVKASVRRALLGRTVDANGVEIISVNSVVPYVAVGTAITKDNGEKELWWLYKGQFAEFEVKAKTKKDDAIEYQTPTLTAIFVSRYDGELGMVVDTDDDDVAEAAISGWFNAVYEKATT